MWVHACEITQLQVIVKPIRDALDAAVPRWKDGRRPVLPGDRRPDEPDGHRRAHTGGGILGVIGGACWPGSFLAWAEVSGGGTSVTAKGVDGSDGYITLVAGLVAVVAGVVMAKSTRRLLAVLVILAGIVGGGIGLYDALTAKDSVLDAAAEELAPAFGVSAQQVRTVLDQAIDAGQLGVSISIGLYVVIGGGVVALVGGILGLRGSGSLPFLARPRRRQHQRPRSAVRACRLIRCLRRPHHSTQAPSVDAGSSRARGGWRSRAVCWRWSVRSSPGPRCPRDRSPSRRRASTAGRARRRSSPVG